MSGSEDRDLFLEEFFYYAALESDFGDSWGVSFIDKMGLDFMTWMSLSGWLLPMRITVIFLLGVIAFFLVSKLLSLCKVLSAIFGESSGLFESPSRNR